jgi:hypothetical protein
VPRAPAGEWTLKWASVRTGPISEGSFWGGQKSVEETFKPDKKLCLV